MFRFRSIRSLFRRPDRRQRPSFVPRLLVLEDRTLPSTLTVLNNLDSGAGSLRAVIVAAQSGDQIVFDDSLRGQTITLTGGELALTKSLDIEGLGADQLAISGNHQSRIFNISGGVTVTIAGLTITEGLGLPGAIVTVAGSPGSGGAIENVGSHLTVADDTFSNNEALGNNEPLASGGNGNGNGRGGAIDSFLGATLTVTHSLFLHNLATGSSAAAAGAIYTSQGTCTIRDSTFIGNQSIGGSDGYNGSSIDGNHGFSRGGAIYNIAGTLSVENSTFTGNQAIGGSNNTGDSIIGLAFGGAIANTDDANLSITRSTFTANQALGGSHNTSTGHYSGVSTGGGLFNVGVATITDSVFEDNETRGGNGNRGDGTSFQFVGTATGGAIATSSSNSSGISASLTLSRVTLRHNRAIGGDGNLAGTFVGTAWGGGLAADNYSRNSHTASTMTMSDSTVADNEAVGGQGADGGNGGDAQGGGVGNFFAGTLTVSSTTITGNRAIGGTAGVGGNGGNGFGGGLFNDGLSTAPTNLGAPTVLTVLNSRIAHNEAEGGTAGSGGHGGDGLGGGLYVAGGDETVTVTVADSRIERNEAEGGAGGDRHHRGNGQGIGGGVYIAGGTVCITNTKIKHNDADTSHDDVFGVFTTDC